MSVGLPIELPAEIIGRFRSKAVERIERIEARWGQLTAGDCGEAGPDAQAVEDVQRDIHTLKGDSRVVGFTDVNLLCHKLEDLWTAAHRLDYRISEEFDLVVTMAVRFLAMLVNKKVGVALGGIDLPGFVSEVDAVLRDARLVQLSEPAKRGGTQKIARLQRQADRLSNETRHQLAAAATTIFLEHLAAPAGARERLYGAWSALKEQLAATGSAALKPLLAKHSQQVTTLAGELGKPLDIRFDAADLRLKAEAADALDTALLHILRNAVDHGIEAPALRRAARKAASARIAVRVRALPSAIEVEIEDDGGGLDFAAIRRRGVETGLLSERRARAAGDEELVDLLFQAGFSTSPEVNDVSGRGVGLDAVRSTLAREGGSIGVLTRPGHGTTFVLRIPQASLVVPVHRFAALDQHISLAVPAGRGWTVRTSSLHGGSEAIEPLSHLGAAAPGSRSFEGCVLRIDDAAARLRVLVWAGGAPSAATAERICPTADDHPSEIVLIDGREAVLLRPQTFATQTKRLPSEELHPS